MIYTVSDYDLGDNDGAVMCTAEMCTSLIVASLPGLKVLITRTMASGTSRSGTGYDKSSKPSRPSSRTAKSPGRFTRPRAQSNDDSELELITVHPQPGKYKEKMATPAESIDLENAQTAGEQDFSIEYGKPACALSNAISLPFV